MSSISPDEAAITFPPPGCSVLPARGWGRLGTHGDDSPSSKDSCLAQSLFPPSLGKTTRRAPGAAASEGCRGIASQKLRLISLHSCSEAKRVSQREISALRLLILPCAARQCHGTENQGVYPSFVLETLVSAKLPAWLWQYGTGSFCAPVSAVRRGGIDFLGVFNRVTAGTRRV